MKLNLNPKEALAVYNVVRDSLQNVLNNRSSEPVTNEFKMLEQVFVRIEASILGCISASDMELLEQWKEAELAKLVVKSVEVDENFFSSVPRFDNKGKKKRC